MPPKKKKGKKGGKASTKKPLDIPTLFYTTNTIMQPELVEELEQCQQEMTDLRQENQKLRSERERDDRDKGLVFESMQERVSRNKEYIKVLIQRLTEAQEIESTLRDELLQTKEQCGIEKAEKERISGILGGMEKDIREAKQFITEKTTLQLLNADLMKEVAALKKTIHRHELTLQVVNTAEHQQLVKFEAEVPEGGAMASEEMQNGVDDTGHIEAEMGSAAMPAESAAHPNDDGPGGEGDQITSVDGSLEMGLTLRQQGLIKPGLIPVVTEAMRLYPAEGAVQRDACFIFMHMAAEGAKVCGLMVQLGVLTYVATAVQAFERDAILLAHAARVFGRVSQHSHEACEVMRRSGVVALLLQPLAKHRFDMAKRFFYSTSKTLQLLISPHTCDIVPQGSKIFQEVQNTAEVMRLFILLLDWCALAPRRKKDEVEASGADAGAEHWEYEAKSDVLKYRRKRLGAEERKRRAAARDPVAAQQKEELERFRIGLMESDFHKTTAARLASGACSALMNTVDSSETEEVVSVVEVDEATIVLVNVLRRFRRLPDVVAAMCILLRIGLHSDEQMRNFQLRFLMSEEMRLVDLLLEIHNPATYDRADQEANGLPLVDERIIAEVGALLTAMGFGSDADINSYLAAEQKRRAGVNSDLVMKGNKKGQQKVALESGMRGIAAEFGERPNGLLPAI